MVSFYISAIDDKLESEEDKPTIGLLLCTDKSDVKVEYAMRGFDKPLGVATYQLQQVIKDKLKQINNAAKERE